MEFIDELPFSGRTSLNKSIAGFTRSEDARISIILSDFCKRRVQGSIQVFNVRTAGYNSGANPCAGRTEPRFSGSLRLIDKETGDKVEVEMSPRTLNMYQKALHSYLEEFKHLQPAGYCMHSGKQRGFFGRAGV